MSARTALVRPGNGKLISLYSTSGFTLIELLTTLLVIAIVMGIVLINSDASSTIASQYSREFRANLAFARSEAVNRARPVIVCASSSAETAEPACEGGWESGWIVYIDQDADGRPSGTEVLRRHGVLGGGISVKASVTALQFTTRGYSDSSQAFSFCSATQPQAGRTVVLAASGRALKQQIVVDCS